MKSNIHRKLTSEDKFARRWWKRNRSYRNEIRAEKKHNAKKFRLMMKSELRKENKVCNF